MAEDEDQHNVADKIKSALGALSIDNYKSKPKSNYAFWSTQPVSQFGEESSSSEVNCPFVTIATGLNKSHAWILDA